MPKMNGYELATEIRKQPWSQDIQLVAVTGWGQSSDRQRALEAGFDAHFVKPVDFTELQAFCASVAGRTTGARLSGR